MSLIYPPLQEGVTSGPRDLPSRPWALFFQQVIAQLQSLDNRVSALEAVISGYGTAQTWTAAITAVTTDPTNITLTYGQYVRIGNTVIGRASWTMAVGFTAGTGSWLVSLPVANPTGTGGQRAVVGFGSLVQGAGTSYYPFTVRLGSTGTNLVLLPDDGGSTPVTGAAPLVLAAGDQMGLTVIYQVTP